MRRPLPLRRVLALAPAALGVLVVPAAGAAAPVAASSCTGSHWVGSWAAAPSDAGFFVDDEDVPRPLVQQTARMVVRPSLSGSTVRVRLSNRYGATPVHLGPVSVARRAGGAAAVSGTVRPVLFGGRTTLDLAPGQDTVSDPVPLSVLAGRDLLVSVHVPGTVVAPSEHFITDQTNYLSLPGTGDHSAQESGAAFPLTTRTAFSNGWFFLSGLDVRAPRSTGAVVAFGDSITDGFQGLTNALTENPASLDANARYPDFLSKRLRAAGRSVGVLNSGISGNKVLTDAMAPVPFGDSALSRFTADALSLPGVTDVVVLEGINDLNGDSAVTPGQLQAALGTLVTRAHRAGLRVHLGTVTPNGDDSAEGAGSTELRRQQLNRWIRTRSGADSVVDFDKAVRDPASPSDLLPAYDSSDHLHPSTAGYRAMAAAVDLRGLGTGCARPAA